MKVRSPALNPNQTQDIINCNFTANLHSWLEIHTDVIHVFTRASRLQILSMRMDTWPHSFSLLSQLQSHTFKEAPKQCPIRHHTLPKKHWSVRENVQGVNPGDWWLMNVVAASGTAIIRRFRKKNCNASAKARRSRAARRNQGMSYDRAHANQVSFLWPRTTNNTYDLWNCSMKLWPLGLSLNP